MDKSRALGAITVVAVVLSVAGCGNSDSGAETGRISIAVSDGPMHDVTKVCIAFDEIELKPKEGAPITAEKLMGAAETLNVNLLDYQGMNAAPLLMDYEVLAGEYLWMRLGVNALRGGMGGMNDADPMSPVCEGVESYLVMNGVAHNLYVPSGDERGLQLNGSIIVPRGGAGAADFTVEVDLMKSVSLPVGLDPDAIFRPTLRVVNNATVGAVSGQVENSLIEGQAGGCAPTVYVFEDDMMDVALDVNDSFASAMVKGETEYHYTVGFLPEGMYEAAFSCDDGVTLQPEIGKPVSIVAGAVDLVDFP